MKQGKARTQKELMSWCRISTVGFQVAAHCKRRCDVLGMMVAPQFQLPTKIRPHSHCGVLTVCYSHMGCALGNKTLKGQPTTLDMEIIKPLHKIVLSCFPLSGDGWVQMEYIKPWHRLFFLDFLMSVDGWMHAAGMYETFA